MAIFGRWRTEREEHRRSETFVRHLMSEPAAVDVEWLSSSATGGDADHARWELRYARRALGLIAAQRDALDDRTASVVAQALQVELALDPNIDAAMLDLVERQFNARLSAYREGLDARGQTPTTVRMGQTLLAFAGGAFRDVDDNVRRAGQLLSNYLVEANEALRTSFGGPSLADGLPPSAAVGRR